MPVKILNQRAPAEIGRFRVGEFNSLDCLLATVDGVECCVRGSMTLQPAGIVTCIPTQASWVESSAPYVEVEVEGRATRIVGGVLSRPAALALYRFVELSGKGVAMQGMEL